MRYTVETNLTFQLGEHEVVALEIVERLFKEILESFPSIEEISDRNDDAYSKKFWLTGADLEEMYTNIHWFRLHRDNLRLEERN